MAFASSKQQAVDTGKLTQGTLVINCITFVAWLVWRFGVAVMRRSQSTQLLYIEPS